MKMLKVAKREYLDRVKKRWFLISTILGPVLMGVAVVLPGLMMSHAPLTRTDIAVVDLTGSVFSDLEAALRDTLPDGKKMFALSDVPATGSDLDAAKKKLTAEVDAGGIAGYLVVPADIIDSAKVSYYGKNVSNISMLDRLRSALNEAVIAKRLAREGLQYSAVKQMLKPIDIETMRLVKGGEKKSEFGTSFLTSFVFIMILYMTILLWGINVQRSIIDEKSNRVIEVLLSSLKPFDIMAGKIIGVGAVGLTQYAIWAFCGMAIAAYALSSGYAQYVSFGPSTLIFFVVFYVFGFLFYATFFAGVGSVCNSDQEAQQLQMPFNLVLWITIMISFAVIQNPDSALSVTLSMIPFFSPILMFMRINVLMPPLWEVALSIAILIASTIACGILSAKVFRIGILMYGKRPDIREIIKWMKRA
jgi:ABC-2 type transport system permease protein